MTRGGARSRVRRLAVGVSVLGLALSLGSPRAAAELVYELAPTVGAGATTNVYGTGEAPIAGMERVSSAFSTAGASMRLRYRGARSDHGLGLRLLYTQYYIEGAPTMFSGNLAWTSGFNLTALWTLRFGAGATLTRTSTEQVADPATFQLQGLTPGTSYYLATNADQDLAYQPSPMRGYGETFAVSQLRYLNAPAMAGGVVLPTTTVFSLGLRGNRVYGRETYSLEAAVADAYTQVDPALATSYVPGHNFIARAWLGWGHELSPVWTTLLQAGPSVIVSPAGNGVLAPAGAATLNYRRLPWYASVSAMQTPAPNLFLGGATLTDQVIARVALPVSKREAIFVGGYGGYIYSRVADGKGLWQRNFDQFSGGLSLYGRLPRLPLTAALTYVAVTQRGSSLVNYEAPDLARQSIFLSLSGELAWGAGTPPLFGGAL